VGKRFKTILRSVLLTLLAVAIVATPVLAFAYSATYTITETGGTPYGMLGVLRDSPNTWLAANNFMETDAQDTRIETLGGSEKPHMVATDKTLAAVPVPADSQTNLYFTTGNADASFDIITGRNGYITIPDALALEPAANFEFEWTDTWLDTSVGASKYLLHKVDAVEVYTGVVNEEVTATIYSAATTEVLAPDGVGFETLITNVVGAATHWQANLTNDGDTSYVSTIVNANLRDTYSCTDSSIAYGPINSVTVTTVVKESAAGGCQSMTALRTHAVTYDGAVKDLGAAYVAESTVYADNPNTTNPWTWAEVDAMEIGVSLKGDTINEARCTQVYVTVDYDPQLDVTATGIASGEHDIEVGLELR